MRHEFLPKMSMRVLYDDTKATSRIWNALGESTVIWKV